MPDLKLCLLKQDLGYLRIVAELWGLEVDIKDTRQGVELLVPLLLERSLVEEVIEALPGEAQLCLQDIVGNQGRLQWAYFARRFGEVREMGPGRRDRERPFEHPISPAELLWYRALVGRAFFDTSDGPQEFAYIPTDLIPLLTSEETNKPPSFGNPASQQDHKRIIPVNDYILDHACTLLAALRVGLPLEQVADNTTSSRPKTPYPLTNQSLNQLLLVANLIGIDNQPKPEETRVFLEAGRAEGLAKLTQVWIESDIFNELSLIPGLILEGEWANEPQKTRTTILGFLSSIPVGEWWSLNAFIDSVRQLYPDFQRPAGNYETWFIRKQETGEDLRGFTHWDEVDGALLRFIISGPMHWLGITDLATQSNGSSGCDIGITAFRLSDWSTALLNGEPPTGLHKEEALIQVSSDGSIRVPRLASRATRYQIARFCEWETERTETYFYKLTPSSLRRARNQGLRSSHLVTLLRRHTETIPPSLVKALAGWEEHGTQARMERLLVLRFKSPQVLLELRESRASRFLGEMLGPTAVIVKPGAWEKVMEALSEMGYLTDIEDVT